MVKYDKNKTKFGVSINNLSKDINFNIFKHKEQINEFFNKINTDLKVFNSKHSNKLGNQILKGKLERIFKILNCLIVPKDIKVDLSVLSSYEVSGTYISENKLKNLLEFRIDIYANSIMFSIGLSVNSNEVIKVIDYRESTPENVKFTQSNITYETISNFINSQLKTYDKIKTYINSQKEINVTKNDDLISQDIFEFEDSNFENFSLKISQQKDIKLNNLKKTISVNGGVNSKIIWDFINTEGIDKIPEDLFLKIIVYSFYLGNIDFELIKLILDKKPDINFKKKFKFSQESVTSLTDYTVLDTLILGNCYGKTKLIYFDYLLNHLKIRGVSCISQLFNQSAFISKMFCSLCNYQGSFPEDLGINLLNIISKYYPDELIKKDKSSIVPGPNPYVKYLFQDRAFTDRLYTKEDYEKGLYLYKKFTGTLKNIDKECAFELVGDGLGNENLTDVIRNELILALEYIFKINGKPKQEDYLFRGFNFGILAGMSLLDYRLFFKLKTIKEHMGYDSSIINKFDKNQLNDLIQGDPVYKYLKGKGFKFNVYKSYF